MKTVLLIKGGRPAPTVLKNYLRSAGGIFQTLLPINENLDKAVLQTDAVLLFSPAWNNGAYLSTGELWLRYMQQIKPEGKLLLAGYQAVEHPNYLDMLQLGASSVSWWQKAPRVKDMPELPTLTGIDLMDKLHRFFAGHGQDSVVAVLSRIRLVTQMASRELQKTQTPYQEIYKELIAPAELAKKWSEWRSRWINYAPLFEFSPIANKLRIIAELASQIETWMMAGGVNEQQLLDGSVLEVLNKMRAELQQIEHQYVVQKLSHSYR
jgi:hypothetical protein